MTGETSNGISRHRDLRERWLKQELQGGIIPEFSKQQPLSDGTEDGADLESIEAVANEVLQMQMPTTPAQLQNLTAEIRERVGSLTDVEDILNQSAADIMRAESLLEQACKARLLKLESDVALLKEKALNTSTSANSTEKEAESINALAEQLKKDLDSELKDKYSSVEELITQKAEGVAEAKKRAEKLQQEAQNLLL
ncbi:hypothetical protein Q8A67_025547 [Cirrhinus molitorella]|uniref:Uncharacterized protein n=1 Tax=Cirrhinus molitorella TaxID=172907 RepID=A0AA88NXT6_9TELE|nr:hypothetical protein Q8A67_025547 [Cirrhinus molitorella]